MVNKKPTKIDLLRAELGKLMGEREKVQMEKGLAAQHNQDIRENADYDYWFQRELHLTVRIKRITHEIEKLYKKLAGQK